MGECFGDRAEACMGDHEVAVREQQALRDVTLDVDVVRLRAELDGVSIPADCQDQIDGFVAQSVEDRLKQSRRAAVEDRAERRGDRRAVGKSASQVGDPSPPIR